jgi:hypothetical protein
MHLEAAGLLIFIIGWSLATELLLEDSMGSRTLARIPAFTTFTLATKVVRSQLRCCKAFLKLARLERIEALPKLTDVVVITDELLL